MEFTTLGRTGRTVSRLGFGGAPAGLTNYLDNYSPANLDQREQVIAAIERAVALGITYFDTAPGYGSGASEAIFGEALADAGDEIFVATKINRDEPNVRAGIEASLTRLRRDQLDLVQIHGSSYSPDLAASILGDGGLLAQLEALREEGLIRHLGFTSEDNNGAVFQFIGCNRFDVMQICYNLLHQHAYEPTRPFGSLLEADKAGMGTVTMRTLTSGLLQKWIRQVNPNDSFDYTPALLQFVLSNPYVDVALVGMRTADEVEHNVAIANDSAGRIDIAALHAKYV
ncbi:MAG: aldo/keto reductase [Caldilineaceae bacterium]|nr:aldo/keto reductase [Caldilineaceae bacterium]